MNVYRQRFTVRCPKNGRPVEHVLTIETQRMIFVEDIQAGIAKFETGYHEEIADSLYAEFGGEQTLEAHHHGTDVKTFRP